MQLESPPMKNPLNPSLLQISLAAEYIEVYPWKQASSKRVSIMLSGFVRKVLIIREREETRKFWPADIRQIQNARRPVKQMQQPKAALRVAAANPLQKPRMPSALQMYLQEVLVLVNTLLASWMGLSSRGGSMSAILIFSKGWRRAVVITPLNIPQNPFSLIMPDWEYEDGNIYKGQQQRYCEHSD